MASLNDALDMAGATDVGRVRNHNEDALLLDPGLGIVVLADGMGGYNAGEIASGIAVDTIGETLRAELGAIAPQTAPSQQTVAHDLLGLAIRRANSAIFETAANNPSCAGMGTTLVCALFFDNHLVCGHVGDSRLYRLRAGELQQLSHDHSLLQEEIDAGLIRPEDARHMPYRNLVTRAVGIEASVEPEIREYAAQPGDLYLFCSDGLTDMVEDTRIGEIIATAGDDLQPAAQALIDEANANGGRDNITVALVGIRRDYAARRGWISRLAAHWGK